MTNNEIWQLGDHLRVKRGGYYHHGIFIGDGQVVHFTDVRPDKAEAVVRRGSTHEFAADGQVEVVRYGKRFDRQTTVWRALSLLGRDNYHLLLNNCEQVARWCATGEFRSLQVEAGVGGAASAAVVGGGPSAALAVVGAAGVAKGLSGAGTMAGLSAIGGAAGAVGGVALVAAVPAVATAAAINWSMLKDDPYATEYHRRALRAGRAGVRVGVAAAAAGGVLAVAKLGTPGLNAAGISSGIKALGALSGKASMVRGLVVLAVGGAVLALIFGAVAYFLARQPSRAPEPMQRLA